ncbi:MAG: hypothetical protein R2932_09280 [Caldilineaceae bacterium]
MLPIILTWLIRDGHVLAGAVWVGGYAALTLALIPRLEKQANEGLLGVTITTMRLLSYTGTATILLGLLLVTRTRGYATIWRGGEWGGIIVACFIIALVLLGLGDGALRPALKQLGAGRNTRRTRRLAWICFVLTMIAIGLMTRTIYTFS